MTPLIILFTYYQDDEVTRLHWRLLRHYNPGVPVIPLVDGAQPFLPGTVDVSGLPWRWGADRRPWHNVDTFVYRWYNHCRQRARRYVMVESDTLVTMPLADYYRGVWHADVAGSVIAYPHSHPGWVWWEQEVGQYRRRRAGVMPSGVMLYSDRALQLLSQSRLGCFAELRIGTLAHSAGLRLATVPDGLFTVDCGDRHLRLGPAPGVYHPVKRLGGRDGLCLAAHQLGASLP